MPLLFDLWSEGGKSLIRAVRNVSDECCILHNFFRCFWSLWVFSNGVEDEGALTAIMLEFLYQALRSASSLIYLMLAQWIWLAAKLFLCQVGIFRESWAYSWLGSPLKNHPIIVQLQSHSSSAKQDFYLGHTKEILPEQDSHTQNDPSFP